jgi:hypothetical protein
VEGGPVLYPVGGEQLLLVIQLLTVEDKDLLLRLQVRGPVQLHLEVLHGGAAPDPHGDLLPHHRLHRDVDVGRLLGLLLGRRAALAGKRSSARLLPFPSGTRLAMHGGPGLACLSGGGGRLLRGPAGLGELQDSLASCGAQSLRPAVSSFGFVGRFLLAAAAAGTMSFLLTAVTAGSRFSMAGVAAGSSFLLMAVAAGSSFLLLAVTTGTSFRLVAVTAGSSFLLMAVAAGSSFLLMAVASGSSFFLMVVTTGTSFRLAAVTAGISTLLLAVGASFLLMAVASGSSFLLMAVAAVTSFLRTAMAAGSSLPFARAAGGTVPAAPASPAAAALWGAAAGGPRPALHNVLQGAASARETSLLLPLLAILPPLAVPGDIGRLPLGAAGIVLLVFVKLTGVFGGSSRLAAAIRHHGVVLSAVRVAEGPGAT